MLQVVFTDRDLARVQIARTPDPLWEITNSLDRLQTPAGRWAFAPWYREMRNTLAGGHLRKTVQSMLIPLLPRAAYFPDFLTPTEAREGLDAGLDAILRTPRARVIAEIEKLDRLHHAPVWGPRVADNDLRQELASALRRYYHQAITPYEDTIQAAVDADRAHRARVLLDGGVERLLDSFRPMMRWRPPVLEVSYPVCRRVALNGTGLVLVPSYFCWKNPVALADPELPPVLIYPVVPAGASDDERPLDEPAIALIGSTRAAVLRATAGGLTTSEIARITGITAPTASHHLKVLRDNNLITSNRHANTMLHVLTPFGAGLLAAGRRRQHP